MRDLKGNHQREKIEKMKRIEQQQGKKGKYQDKKGEIDGEQKVNRIRREKLE